MVDAPRDTITLLERDGQVVTSIDVPQTFEPYDLIIWKQRFFMYRTKYHYAEAVSYSVP